MVSRQRLSQLRNPVKHAARSMATAAIASGVLARPNSCSRCAVDCKPHAHHEDYEKPLDVTWLCPPCHGAVHAEKNAASRPPKPPKVIKPPKEYMIRVRATREQRAEWKRAAKATGRTLSELIRAGADAEVEYSQQVAALRKRINEERSRG